MFMQTVWGNKKEKNKQKIIGETKKKTIARSKCNVIIYN